MGVYYGHDLVYHKIYPWHHAQATSRLVRCQLEGNPPHTAWENSAYKAHLQQPKFAAHYQRWIRIRSQVQHHLREMRNGLWMTKAQEIEEHVNNNNIRAFYGALKSVFGPIRRSFCHVKDNTETLLIKERDGILLRWAEHFNTLLNKKNPSGTFFLDSLHWLPPITCLDNTPTLTEVRSAISGLKSSKACGVDHLPVEVFNTGERTSMSTCMSSSAKFVALAESLRNGRILALSKVTAPTVVTAVASRCYQLVAGPGKCSKFINRLFTHVAEVILPESQCGFRWVVPLLTWSLSHVCFKKNVANISGHSIWHL